MTKHIAIITGATKPIGKAITLELSRLINPICILPVYDWLEELESLKNTLKSNNVSFVIYPADLRKETDVRSLIDFVIKNFSRIDYLVNNIERGGWPIVHGEYDEGQWELEFNTTLTAKYLLLKNALPHIKDAKGAALNISSIAGLTGQRGNLYKLYADCYSLCNRAIGLLTESFARLAAPEARVNELMLGLIESRHGPHTRGWSLLTEEERTELINEIPLKRIGTPQEVAKIACFILLEATYMTGSVIRLDGGLTLGAGTRWAKPQGIVKPDEKRYGGTSIEDMHLEPYVWISE